MENYKFHLKTVEETERFLKTNAQEGLTNAEVSARIKKFGKNELKEQKKTPLWKKFLSQFSDFMVVVLLFAAAVSLLMGEFADAGTIFIIVFFNAVLGFLQEYRAEKSMTALKKLSAPTALVMRGGAQEKTAADKIVPGDIVLLHPGDKVPADARLASVHSLEIEESMLTGESQPVKKRSACLAEDKAVLNAFNNMVYAGTTVTNGHGKAIVCHTGMYTEIGKIAGLLQKSGDETTPLEKRLEQLGKRLVAACLLICLAVVAIGLAKGEPFFIMCMAGISLAVAAIPEGLPAIVTVALALGVQRMIKRCAIVRKLPAVETLGCVNVICSDKTGTLTKNQMTAKEIYTCSAHYKITGDGYDIRGEVVAAENTRGGEASLIKCLEIAALCNNSALKRNGVELPGMWRKKKSAWEISGDPTEGAMIVAAAKKNIWREKIEKEYQRLDEVPFESSRKMMSIVSKRGNAYFVFTKGAPDRLLKRCSRYLDETGIHLLTDKMREKITQMNEAMATQSLRVLAVAYRELKSRPDIGECERDLVFSGLIGMIDPPREGVKDAIQLCRQAGIKTVMITGDHPGTAMAIARKLAIYRDAKDQMLTGEDLDKLDESALCKLIPKVRIFARVSPLHKLKIVKCLKQSGHVVAMTGDGVNDAPAIKEADIGIAMGNGGTDVAKEAAAMVLTDDNFSTIAAAVEEGRSIYENIRKFIRYLLACNTGEILTMFIAALMSLPMPLLPVQILWVNLVTDGLPAMALGVDKNDQNIMLRPPRRKNESIFSRGLQAKIIWRGLQIGLSTVGIFLFVLLVENDLALARTVAFTTLVFLQLFHVFDCRSEYVSAVEAGILKNKYLIFAVGCSVVMQLSVIYHPFLSDVFYTVPLGPQDWCLILLLSGWNFILNMVRNLFFTQKVAQKAFSK